MIDPLKSAILLVIDFLLFPVEFIIDGFYWIFLLPVIIGQIVLDPIFFYHWLVNNPNFIFMVKFIAVICFVVGLFLLALLIVASKD